MLEKTDSKIFTFNTAKQYAEEILFPKMDLYQQFQRKATFGCIDMNASITLPEEVREIERFNGLKGMASILYDLLVNVSSTVRLKKNREEVPMLNELLSIISNVKKVCEDYRGRFFCSVLKDGKQTETINRHYFNQIKEIVDSCYINTEILMTRNRLLFSDDSDDFLSDQELLNQIKGEYVES